MGHPPLHPTSKVMWELCLCIDQPGDARFALSKICKTTTATLVQDVNGTGRNIPTTYVAYPAGRTTDGALNTDLTTAGQSFPSLSKYIDGSRNSLNDVVGHRDFILAQFGRDFT